MCKIGLFFLISTIEEFELLCHNNSFCAYDYSVTFTTLATSIRTIVSTMYNNSNFFGILKIVTKTVLVWLCHMIYFRGLETTDSNSWFFESFKLKKIDASVDDRFTSSSLRTLVHRALQELQNASIFVFLLYSA